VVRKHKTVVEKNQDSSNLLVSSKPSEDEPLRKLVVE
jgi:hypothetical protein